jgi:H+-transporting ATPase
VPIEEVFQSLRCNSNGLTTDSAKERLAIFGHNKLEEKQVFPFNLFFFFHLKRSFLMK